ncbi:hypothetical protein, partial [Salmonella enterica]|uniref:hypothetical protein n=1 Tax=Salmonella enterica TaxID=28901 RepID=UPI003D27DD3B
VGIFAFLAMLLSGLNWIFFFAIALGVIRALGMTGLALFPDRRVGLPHPDEPEAQAYRPLVSVIIPAYNEERVIEASVRRILASGYHPIE